MKGQANGQVVVVEGLEEIEQFGAWQGAGGNNEFLDAMLSH
jgi:hypothetical protein